MRALRWSALAGAAITAIGWGASLVPMNASGTVGTLVLLPAWLVFGALFAREPSAASDYVVMTVFAWVLWTVLLAPPMVGLASWRARHPPRAEA